MVGQRPAAVHRIGIGRVGALRIEVFLVETVDVRRNEVGQPVVGLEARDAGIGPGPQLVEQLDRIGRVFERGRLEGKVVDAVVVDQTVDTLQESVEGVVTRRRGSVADPHRNADILGEGLFEKRRFGLFEFRARKVVHVGVDQRRDLFVNHREVVGGRESQFGLHPVKVDRLLVLGRRFAPGPACGGEFLKDVALAVPELDVRGLGHVVEYAHAEVLRRFPGEHRAEEDVFEVGTGVLFRIFEIGHGDDVFEWL